MTKNLTAQDFNAWMLPMQEIVQNPRYPYRLPESDRSHYESQMQSQILTAGQITLAANFVFWIGFLVLKRM